MFVMPGSRAGRGQSLGFFRKQLTRMLGLPRGAVLYQGPEGLTYLPPSAPGKILQTNGPDADISWVTPGVTSSGFALVKKSVNESRNTTTTFADDSELFVDLDASSTYYVQFRVNASIANSTMGFKRRLNYTGTIDATLGASDIFSGWAFGVSGSNTGNINTNLFTTTSPIISTNIFVSGAGEGGSWDDLIINTTTAGRLSFQWAQNTSNGSNATVRGGSLIAYSKAL